MRSLICLTLLVFGAAIAPAQEKVIDQTAFDAVVKAGGRHTQKWAGKMYRMTVSTSATMIDRPELDHSAKMIFEYGLNGDFRNSSSSATGGKATTTESISVGNWIYSRKDSQPWLRRERQSGSGSGQSSDKNANTVEYEVLSSVTDYKYLGAGELRGVPVQIYLRTERTKKVNKSNGVVTDSETARKYWINAESLILKSEFISDNRWSNSRSHNQIVTEWELDPTIVFKEPQIAQQP
jgi:hypothetical protein